MKAGWKTVKLGEVARYDKVQGIHSGLPYVGLEHIESGTRKFIGSRSDMEVQSSSFLFNPHHVLYGRLRPYLRKVLVPDFAGHCSTEIFPILPSSDLDRSYLSYWLIAEFTTSAIDRLCNGARMPRANMEQALELEIPLPPLAEQKRIVALLDEAFAGIDEAKAKAENTMQGYDILSRGITERLVFPVDSVHPIKALGEVVEIARGGSPRPIQNYFTDAADGINWIKISDATASGKYIYKTVQKIKPSGLKKTRMVKPGDFLLSNSMSFGRPYIMKTSGCIHDGWLVLSGVERELDHDYLYHVLGSNSVYAQFDRLAAGSTVRNLNSESASKVLIPVPPIPLQKEIARKLDDAQEVIAVAKQLTSEKHEALISLRASILAQAFAGELTA
jgi:type I restriction enzyme S subunit